MLYQIKFRYSLGSVLEIMIIICQIGHSVTQVFHPAIIAHKRDGSNSEVVFIAYLNKCQEIQEKTDLEKRLQILETKLNLITEKLDNNSKNEGEIPCKKSEDHLESSNFSGTYMKQFIFQVSFLI